MVLSKEQKNTHKNYVMQNYDGNTRINLKQLNEILGLNIQDKQLFGYQLLKMAHVNKEEFALIIGIDFICDEYHPINIQKFSFIKVSILVNGIMNMKILLKPFKNRQF